jgi:outer membrane lipoprotein carrier protein
VGAHSYLGRLLLLLTVSISIAAEAADVGSTARAVDEKYNHLQTFQADFSEIYRGAGAERTESGTLWLKKPGKMRWEYRSPKEKLFLSDGRSAWFWVVGERQVQRTQLKQLEDLRSPIAFLLGRTKLEKELQALSFAPDIVPLEPGDVVLRGVPKAMADRVAQIVLEITPEHWIRRILIEEVDASTTEYRFTDQKENLTVPDQKFQFQLPAGAEVIDGEIGP